MSLPATDNISPQEANRSGNRIQVLQLPQDQNPSEMNTVEDLRRKLHELEKKCTQEMFDYEKEVRQLRLDLVQGEALRRGLESEVSFVRKQANMQMNTAENELSDVKSKLQELQVLNDKHQQKAAETEKMFQSAQGQWEEEQQRFAVERDNIRREHLAEVEFLIKEKNKMEAACQETNAALQNMLRILKIMEVEHHGCSEMLRVQAIQLDFKDKRHKKLMGELEKELAILLDLYQRMADGHVLAKQPDVPLEGLPWTEFCILLHENVETLIVDFHKARERISHLEYICKHKTDTVNDLQQNQEDALEKMSEQLKAQEHCWQKEKQYLEQRYSNLLAEIHRRAQECEETAQKNRQKLYDLEQVCEKVAHENNSLRNTLSDAFKARSSLLAACALLSGALCPLYGRLRAMSSQRNLLQDQVNLHELLNQNIRSVLYALHINMENNQDEARLRQRRARHLVYVFRRAVIAVLAANRIRALARNSSSLFIWTDGSRGSIGIQVCVGESKGRHHVSKFEEEGVDCIEALDWLTSCNLYNAIISSISELWEVLSKPDPHSWLSGHSLVSAARNSFAKLMDNLSVLMEPAQGNPCGCRVYLERDSLIQRLACGLQRVCAQALEAGFYDRLSSTRNMAILQQEAFKLSQRLHMTEVECRSLYLQLTEFKWTFNEMQKDAEKAHILQEQLNALQHKMITQDNINEELDNALQRERDARLLLQEYERRLQDLNNRLELHSGADANRNQDSNVAPMSLSNAVEELRRRDEVLNHQGILLKDMEQDRQRLGEALLEAERALQQAAKDKELIINHMKAVDATLNAVRDEAVASGAAAATLLPSLQLETLSEEAMRDRPEAIAFQHVLRHFMELYSLAAARVETLTTGREPLQVHFEPEAAVTPPAPAPAPHESLHVHFEPEAGGPTPAPSPSPAPGESSRVHLAGTPPAPAAAPHESLRVLLEPAAAGTPPAPAPAQPNSFWHPVLPQAPPPPPAPALAQHESFWGRIGLQLDRTPLAHARESDEPFQPQFVPRGAAAPHGPETEDIFRVIVQPRAPCTPPAPVPAPDDIFQPHLSPQAVRTPPAPVPAPADIFQPRVSPQPRSRLSAPSPAPDGTAVFPQLFFS
ncbi:coiled-coil domain-containing protein 171-like [Chamaea fasciata]|uniref:coiled-coil domain-containing protein 171-like n=1 Tax=Chamaea fasciata TaxID=190680 RepID=UPI003369C401